MASDEKDRLNIELHSKDRENAMKALGRLKELLRAGKGNDSSLGLLSTLLDSSDVELRRAASWSIGKLGQNKVVHEAPLDKLNALLADEDDEVRENAAWALGEMVGTGMGKEESIDCLNSLLVAGNAEAKSMAAWALGRIAEHLQLGHSS